MSDLSNLKLFATQPHPCSYLDDRDATTLLIDPDANVTTSLSSPLTGLGFRRGGRHLYRPHCATCQPCVACRIPVRDFEPTRNQKRCWRRNQALTLAFVDDISTDEHYALYADYISTRHRDGDMYPPSRNQYDALLSSEGGPNRVWEFPPGARPPR